MAKKTKVELITALPSDPATREKLKAIVESMVSLKRQRADLQEDISEIRKNAKDDNHFSPKFLNSLVTREFDVRYQAEKKAAALDQEQETYAEADILFGRSGS